MSKPSIVRVGDVYRSKDPREKDRRIHVIGKADEPNKWQCARGSRDGRVTIISAKTLDTRWELVEIAKPTNFILPEAACTLILRTDVPGFASGLRLLAVSRRGSTEGEKRWGLPGGKVDRVKDALRNNMPMLVNAARRETREESGIICEIKEPFFIALSNVTTGNHAVTTFIANYVDERPTEKIEKDIEHRWMTDEEFFAANAFPAYNRLMFATWTLRYNSANPPPDPY
jgi:8-oxo-dGTP pyrophosphatase MutT (NUDIX family)